MILNSEACSVQACHYISDHSEAEVVVCDGKNQLEKYLGLSKSNDTLPHLKTLVVYNVTSIDEKDKERSSVPIYTFEEFLELGKDVEGSTVDDRMKAQKPGYACNLVYTSGTTGPPKAAMISHDNLVFCCDMIINKIGKFSIYDRSVSYLPLSHIAALLLDVHGPIYIGCEIYFAQPDVMKGSLTQSLSAAQPTWFFGVPRVYEKIYEKMMEVGKATKGIKKTIATWAKGKGALYTEAQQYGGSGKHPSMYWLANKLVFSAVREKLGLTHCWGCFTSAAPISPDLLRYFGSIGIPVYEVFGQSECTGPHTVCFEGSWKIGTTGRPIRGTQSKIDPDTGELCYRGRHIFLGYLKAPEKTMETIDKEGWLHSGDVAAFDGDDDTAMKHPSGFLKITGRIKDIIITAGGENITPTVIEESVKKIMPYVSNVMVVGDSCKYLCALISLKSDFDPEGGETETLNLINDALETSQSIGSSATTVEQVKSDEKWAAHLDKDMEEVNKFAVSRAGTIKKWALLPTDLSEKGGELTPTMKLKRHVTVKKYADLIETLYCE